MPDWTFHPSVFMLHSATTPRVVRSPGGIKGQVIVMNGTQFEDGKDRYVVGYDVTLELAEQLAQAVQARDAAEARIQAAVDPVAEMSMHCWFHGPHDAHTWQMSLTGYCDCPGNPLTTQPSQLESDG